MQENVPPAFVFPWVAPGGDKNDWLYKWLIIATTPQTRPGYRDKGGQ